MGSIKSIRTSNYLHVVKGGCTRGLNFWALELSSRYLQKIPPCSKTLFSPVLLLATPSTWLMSQGQFLGN
jgi:hypothetical protein